MCESLSFEVESADAATVVTVTGEIDAMTAPALRETLESLTGHVVIDLAAVPYIDSSGLRVIDQQHGRLSGDHGRITLRNPRPPIRRVLEVTGLSSLLDD